MYHEKLTHFYGQLNSEIAHRTWNFLEEEIKVVHEMKDVKGTPDGFEPVTQ